MYSVKLDENKYFTGSYASVGHVDGGIFVDTLPEDMMKATCYKYDIYSKTEIIKVPVIDSETGEQELDDLGEPVFKESSIETPITGWIFDEAKFISEQQAEIIAQIRIEREKAFAVIDKYQLVLYYNDLTETQKEELATYRKAWLDAPDTRSIPKCLEWLI